VEQSHTLPAPLLVAALGLLGLLLAAPMTAALIALGHRAGTMDSSGSAGHAKELRHVPNIGGVAIALAVCVPVAAGLCVAWLTEPAQLRSLAPSLAASTTRIGQVLAPAAWILAGAAAMHVMGLVDDRRAIPAWPKLLAQLGIALATVLLADIRVLTLLDHYPGGVALSVGLTTLWIVALCNSINFLDNMDGLAGGVGAIGALALCVGACIARQWLTAALLALLAGALVGFLLFNAPWTRQRAARIFMGDGGSLLVGFLLAVLSVRIVFVNADEPDYALGTHWYGVLAPLVILAVPLYDTFTVTVLRLLQGRSPMVGDQQHFSHRLVARGMSVRAAVLVIWCATAVTGIGGVALGTLAAWQAVLVGVQTLLVVAMIGVLEYGARRDKRTGVEGAR
jgi:UDP-GlcNAc:undecaprenyl-phosphate GlcNAc-1-phosphate transferase